MTTTSAIIPLSNIKAQWERLSKVDQAAVQSQLEETQKKERKTLSVDGKKAAPTPPKTLTREWQEASNERAREQRMNPISGITSKGYSGQGFVQTK